MLKLFEISKKHILQDKMFLMFAIGMLLAIFKHKIHTLLVFQKIKIT